MTDTGEGPDGQSLYAPSTGRSVNTVEQLERRNQTGHKIDLIENALKEEAAETGEDGAAEIAPTVEIVRPNLVRCLQVLEIIPQWQQSNPDSDPNSHSGRFKRMLRELRP